MKRLMAFVARGVQWTCKCGYTGTGPHTCTDDDE